MKKRVCSAAPHITIGTHLPTSRGEVLLHLFTKLLYVLNNWSYTNGTTEVNSNDIPLTLIKEFASASNDATCFWHVSNIIWNRSYTCSGVSWLDIWPAEKKVTVSIITAARKKEIRKKNEGKVVMNTIQLEKSCYLHQGSIIVHLTWCIRVMSLVIFIYREWLYYLSNFSTCWAQLMKFYEYFLVIYLSIHTNLEQHSLIWSPKY